MAKSKHQNLTDHQFVGLLGIITEPTGYEVEFPEKAGDDVVVKHFSGVQWTIPENGAVGQNTWEPPGSGGQGVEPGQEREPHG